MTWKAYALVSGAGLLATYLASAPPTYAPTGTPPGRINAAAPPPPPMLDIRQQASRLAARVQPDVAYEEPSRDPFRFAARQAPARSASPVAAPRISEPATPAVAVAPPAPPPITVSGIATSTAGGESHRVAILITPQGVVDVRDGDIVAGQYRVIRVEDNAVEISGPDGVSRRLVLRP